MKRLKRLLVTLLTAAMVVNTMPVSGIEAFAAQTETGEEKISITGEETVDEQLTGDEVADPEEDKDAESADISDENEEVAEDEDADTSDSEGTDTVSANDSDPAEEEAGQISEDKLDGYMSYGIWIGDQEFTEVTTIIWDKDHSGYAEYDDSTHTITFHDFGGVSELNNSVTLVTGSQVVITTTNTVYIEGKATLTNTGGDYGYGIYDKVGSLVIDEDADITVKSKMVAIYVQNGDLDIKGKVDASTTGSTNRNAIECRNTLNIFAGSDVTAKTELNYSDAIYSSGNINIYGGNIVATAPADYSHAISAYSGHSISIYGGTITATAGGSNSVAIGSNDTIAGCDVYIAGGTITASCPNYAIYTKGNLAINTADVLIKQPENGKVSDDSHAVVYSNGTKATYVELLTPTKYDLWVGSTRVNSENKDNIPVQGSGSAKYDPSTKTLTFSGEVNGVVGTYTDIWGTTNQIYSEDDLNIVGNAKLQNDSADYGINLLVSGDLNIKGNVSVKGTQNAVYVNNGYVVLDGTINAQSENHHAIRVYYGSLTLKGNITAISKAGKAICADGNIVINTTSLSATSETSPAIESGSGSISINSGAVRAVNNYGGYAIGASSGITIASGLSIVEPEGGKVVGNYICKSDGTTVADEVKITTVISSITATSSDIDSIVQFDGDVSKDPTFTVTAGKPTYFTTNGWWQKKNGGTWEGVYTGKFDAGTYRYLVQIMIDGEEAVNHELNKNGVSVKVNGKSWTQSESVTSYDNMSFTFVYSPEYTINVTGYDLWVGSTRVTSANKDNIPVTGGGKATFNPSTNTLTFTGTVTGVTGEHDHCLIYSELTDLTIKGNATLQDDSANYGIFAKNLTIDGAKLDVKGFSGYGQCVRAEATLTVKNNGELKTNYQNYGQGIYAHTLKMQSGKIDSESKQHDAISVKNLNMTGGQIKATTKGMGSQSGIWVADGSFEMTGGSIYTKSENYYGIYLANVSHANIKSGTIEGHVSSGKTMLFSDAGDINISGGTIKAYNDVENSWTIYGIKSYGKVSVTGGRIDLYGKFEGSPISIGSGRRIICPVGGKLNDDASQVVDEYGDEAERVVIAGSDVYVVTFDLNGKTGTGPGAVAADNGSKLTKPADPKSTGFVFDGWYKEATCKNAWNFSTDTVTSNRILYAKWKPVTYTVKYNSNKPAEATKPVTGTTASSTHVYDTEKALTSVGYMLEGYTFKEWNTKADGTGLKYFNDEIVKNLSSTNGATVVLYAQWKKTTRTVVHEITATSTDLETIPMGGISVWNKPTFTVTGGQPAYFDVEGSGRWQKKNGDTWVDVYSGDFSEGIWRFYTEVRIDGSDGANYELGAPISVKVNGKSWEVSTGTPSVYDDCSWEWVASPEITLTASDVAYDLWVGSTRVTGKNKDNIPGITGGGKASFDPATSTLTFTGKVTGVTGTGNAENAQIYSLMDKLVIKGSATLKQNSKTGIYASKDLIIDGAKLDISASDRAIHVYSNDASLTVKNNADLKLIATEYCGVDTGSFILESGKVHTEGGRYGVDSEKNVIVNGGELNTIATGNNSPSGIYSPNFVMNGGKVYTESKEYVALYITNNVDINGGSFEAVSYGSSGWVGATGIYADGDISITGGTVKLTGPCYAMHGKKKLNISGGTIEASGMIEAAPISIGSGMAIKTPVGAKVSGDGTKIVDKDGGDVSENILIAGSNICVVSFDLNGAEGVDPEAQLITKGNKAVKPSDPVPPKYCVFTGWYKEKECKNLYNFGAAVNSSFVLYAGFKTDMTGAVDITSTFTDPVVRKYVSDNFDTDKDGKLSKLEISKVTDISLPENAGIKSLKGIEVFKELLSLKCIYNDLTEVDLNSNTKLEVIELGDNRITSLKVDKLTNLVELYAGNNELDSIDIKNSTNLQALWLDGTNIESIDISNNTKITELSLSWTGISSMDLGKQTNLVYLDLRTTGITSIDLSKNTKLTSLYLADSLVTELNLAANTKLELLDVNGTKLGSLDLSNNTKIRELYVENCGLKSLDVSKLTLLKVLFADDNELTSLDLSKNTNLIEFGAPNNKLPYVNLTNCNALTDGCVYLDNNIYELGEVGESYKVTNIPGFDPSKATNWKGAVYDSATKSIRDFSCDTVTYDYTCRNGITRQFAMRLILKGVETCKVTFEGKGMEPVSCNVVKNGKVTFIPASPSATGYQFMGWYITDESGAEIPYDFDTPVTKDITIHAKMKAITYKVHFEPNGATGSMPDIIREYADGRELPECAFNYDGRAFKGWNTKADGTGTSYADRSTLTLTSVKDKTVTLYAQWDNWGEVPVDVRNDLFGGDLDQANAYINGGVWYAFYDGSKWRKNTETLKKTYTGDAITFNKDIMVFHGFRRLWENRDYTVSYANNKLIVNGKNPSFTVKGKGSYNNSKTYGFTIEAADISDALVTSESVVTLAVKSKLGSVKSAVTFNGKKLSAGKDYDLVYFDGDTTDDSKRIANAAAFVIADANRTYTVAVKGKGNFKGLLKAANVKTIDPKAANTVQASKLNVTDKNGKAVKNIVIAYSGNAVNTAALFDNTAGKTPDYQVVNASKKVLTYGTDYVVESADGELKAAGKYTLRILGKGSANADGITYVGSKSIACQIAGIDISKAKIAGMNTSVEYTGRPIELKDLFNSKDKNLNGGWDSVTLYTIDSRTKAKKKLTLSEDGVTGDYMVSMANNGAVGKFDIVFTGINGCSGTLKKSVKVTAYNVNDLKKDVIQRKIRVSVNGNAAYSKDGAIPNVTVTFNGTLLREGIDYKLAYKNNKKAVNDYNSLKAGARPTVTVKGLGNFAGSNATAYFNIEKRVISESNISVETADIAYNAKGKAGYFLPKPNQIKLMDGSKALTVGKGKDIEALSAADYSFTYANAVTLADGTVKAAGSAVNANDKLPADKTTVIKVTVSVLSSGASPYSTGGTKKDISGTYKVIAAAKNIKSVKVSLKPEVKTSFNNGEAISITAKDLIVSIKQGKVFAGLTADTDYEVVSVKNNRFLGTATVTIKGKGQYGGTKTFTFKIGARSIFR